MESSHWILDSLHLSYSHSSSVLIGSGRCTRVDDSLSLAFHPLSCGHVQDTHMRCIKNNAAQVEFQSVVANLLRYCRHGEAMSRPQSVCSKGKPGLTCSGNSDTKEDPIVRDAASKCIQHSLKTLDPSGASSQARRLFRALIGEGGLGRLVKSCACRSEVQLQSLNLICPRLTWQELGISKVASQLRADAMAVARFCI